MKWHPILFFLFLLYSFKLINKVQKPLQTKVAEEQKADKKKVYIYIIYLYN